MIQALASKTRKLRLAIPLSLLALAVIAFATLRAERVEVARVEQGDMRQAVVVSSAIAIPISLIGATGLAITGPHTAQTVGYVHLPAFVGISAVSMLFANWGASLSQRMDKRKLQRAFAVFLALVAAHMLFF